MNLAEQNPQKTAHSHDHSRFPTLNIQPIAFHQQQPEPPSRRIPQSLILFWLVMAAQIFTTYSISFLRVIPDKSTTYLIYIVGTPIRASIWFFNSYRLTGCSHSLFRVYFLPDNILLYVICSSMTYIALNYKNPNSLGIAAMCLYPVMLFFLTGNFRVMILYCQWKKWQIVFYKIVRFNFLLFYLGWGVYNTVDSSFENKDIYILFLFTTVGLYGQMIAAFNVYDSSDEMTPNIGFKTEEAQNLIGRFEVK